MSIFVVHDVPLMYQKSDGVCWYASARMLYTWGSKTKRGAMTNPANDPGYFQRYMNNGDVDSSQNWHVAQQFNMKKHETLPQDFQGLKEFLTRYGPVWSGIKKNWDGFDHGHVVVITGVAETGVQIHDPEPVMRGTVRWLTWEQFKTAVNAQSGNPQFLTAA